MTPAGAVVLGSVVVLVVQAKELGPDLQGP